MGKLVTLPCLVCGRPRSKCVSPRSCVLYTGREVKRLRTQLETLRAALAASEPK